MRERLALHATVFTMVLALALCPCAWAQQQAGRAAGEQVQNPNAGAVQNQSGGQNRNQAASDVETIRGVIAAVTAEGEVILDYRTNTAARTEGAFLTIVGSPVKSEAGDKNRQASASEGEKRGWAGKQRHNVYFAWLMPQVKIYEAMDESAESNQNQRQNQGETRSQTARKELAFDQLEVGDHVEMQFSNHEESASTNNVHQSQQMRQKHGRQRTFVGFARSIRVLPTMDHDKSKSGGEAKSSERPQ